MLLEVFYLTVTGVSMIQGKDFVCFDAPKIVIETNNNYFEASINCSKLSPLTFQENYVVKKVLKSVSAQVNVWLDSKRRRDVLINSKYDICRMLANEERVDIFGTKFFGDSHGIIKIFKSCPIQKGTYNIPDYVFKPPQWAPLSNAVAHLEVVMSTTENQKSVQVISVELQVPFRRKKSKNKCPDFE